MFKSARAPARFWDRGVPVGTLREQTEDVLADLNIRDRSSSVMNNPGYRGLKTANGTIISSRLMPPCWKLSR